MTEAEKLLQETKSAVVAETQTEDICVIDSDMRIIDIPEQFKVLGVESDKDVKVMQFRIPKTYKGTDLSAFTISVNYQNARGTKGRYIVTDKKVSGDQIEFSWTVGKTATVYRGDTRFIVCMRLTGSDGVIEKEFNTTLATMTVLEGLEVDDPVIEQEEKDIIAQLLQIVNDKSKEAVQAVTEEGTKQIKALQSATSTAATAKKNLDAAIGEANTAKSQLSDVITSAGKIKADLSEVITQANTAKSKLDASVTTANQVLQSLDAENTSAASNIEELRGENFNSQEILAGVADLRAYLGLTDDDIVGVQVDYKNKSFKRIAGAVNLQAGADFDRFSMFGGRRRCNVADDGTIVAWHGDPDYKEDGTMGQVMVYQPKFYYLVCPVVYDSIETGIGYHLRKANYYVSEKPRAGFRLHPAFYDANGNEIDYFLTSAYEGSIWDADGDAYLLQDEQVMNAGGDKFSSISGARPASGSTQGLARTAIEQMAQNRGANWHGDLIKQVSAEQMLMIIEMGMMNLQTAIAQGVVTLPWETGSDKTSSYAAVTGSTSGIGNGTGRAERTTTYEGGVAKEYTVDGKTSVCWRGKENFWGNIWKFVYGINIWGNGKMGGGQPYICSDFNFAENKNSGNYEGAGFTATNVAGYISAMGYSTICDWLFIASECTGNSSLPVGDYTYITQNLNGYRIALLGGGWNDGGVAGAFYWLLTYGVGGRARNIGGRLVYIPTRDSAEYTATIASWKEQMKKAA